MADDPTAVIGASLDELLLGIAHGLESAQAELDRDPRAAVRYHVPRLDFDLKVTLHIESPAAGAGSAKPAAKLKLRPFAPGPTTGGSTADVVSTIHGSFVAVPVNGGAPAAQLAVMFATAPLRVQLVLAAVTGTPLEGRTIELDIDREESRRVNGRELSASTDVVNAVVVTDAAGRASSPLEVHEPARTIVVLRCDAAGQVTVVRYEVPS
jgi:hypothetical protein